MRSKMICRKLCTVRYLLAFTVGLIVTAQLVRTLFGKASFPLSLPISVGAPAQKPGQPLQSKDIKDEPAFEIRVLKEDETEKKEELTDSPASTSVEMEEMEEFKGPQMKPQRLTCQTYDKKRTADIATSQFTSDDLSLATCQEYCIKASSVFMGITNGTSCNCMNLHGTDILLKDSDCNIKCSSGESCGGENSIEIYRIDTNDGHTSWTTWMRYAGKDGKVVSTRYRDCKRSSQGTICHAKLQKQSSEDESDENYSDNLVGCFTSASFDKAALTNAQHIDNTQSAHDPADCLETCSGSDFAVFVDESKCVCTSSLGWSQPTDSCKIGFGALVMSTNPIKDNSVYLKFEARLTEKLAAVIAHYRGGSTVASAMFYLIPGSLSIYEPGRLFGKKWPGVSQQGKEAERCNTFFDQVYPAWFDCDMLSLPGVFYNLYPGPHGFDKGFESYKKCKWKMQGDYIYAINTCAPFLQEKCLMAPTVTSKTVKILNGPAIQKAIEENPNVHFIHASRDPRAMHASRAKMIRWYREEPVVRIQDTCWELGQLYDVFSKPKANTHVLHYEDIATDAMVAAEKLYKSMDMNMTEEMRTEINKLSGDGAVRKSAFDIAQPNPKSRIFSWVGDKKMHDNIHKADSTPECKDMFSKYTGYYKPLTDLMAAGVA